jgi:hypothetical protein
VERPAVRGLISYLNPKATDEQIPKKTCMADTVNTKVEKLDDITIELIKVCIPFILGYSFTIHCYSDYFIEDLCSLGWVVNQEPSPTHVSQHRIHSFSCWKRQPVDFKESPDRI